MTKRRLVIAVAGLLVVVLVVLYAVFDPATSGLFPRCPFRMLTGLRCPGCGSQRAVHALLHGDLLAAMRANLLLVLFIPYVVCGLVLDCMRRKGPRATWVHATFYGQYAAWIILGVLFAYWILRNVPPFEAFL